MNTDAYETIVIGGGQAGLSVGYHLAKRNRKFVILDENERVGDAWRSFLRSPRGSTRGSCSCTPPSKIGRAHV